MSRHAHASSLLVSLACLGCPAGGGEDELVEDDEPVQDVEVESPEDTAAPCPPAPVVVATSGVHDVTTVTRHPIVAACAEEKKTVPPRRGGASTSSSTQTCPIATYCGAPGSGGSVCTVGDSTGR